ncbi:hypothetical protein GCM10022222_57630 [Amycolatopsis ultiminotia]|uniref:Uncharacterized protein n=1 Tax=Amycolatopsis ultiminotia TaxID=543629 RepID=A0ABP6XF05_9PSEU
MEMSWSAPPRCLGADGCFSGGADAEVTGEDHGGNFEGQLEERGAAGLAGPDSEVVLPVGQLCGADRPSGSAAGKQQGRGRRGANVEQKKQSGDAVLGFDAVVVEESVLVLASADRLLRCGGSAVGAGAPGAELGAVRRGLRG